MTRPSASDADDVPATRLLVLDLVAGTTRVLGDRHAGPEGDDVLHVDPAGAWLLLLYRRSADEPFRRVRKTGYDDEAASVDLLSLVPGHDEGYALSDAHTGRNAVYRFDFAAGELGAQVFEHPTNDVDDFALDPNGHLAAVYYTDDRERVHWLEPRMQARQPQLERHFPRQDVYVLATDHDATRFVAWAGGSNQPGAYYFYEATADRVQLLAQVNDRLDPGLLARTEHTAYRARHGLEVPAYLTLPVGREPTRLPLVVMPHGGPYYVRDVLEYNPEVQFLANRGYAVLQPSFRGSSGYGLEFQERGEGQWGRAMQDDVDDGVDWQHTVGTEGHFDLDAISPLRQVSRLTRPVLLVHGDADERVPFGQAIEYRDALARTLPIQARAC